MHNPKQTRLWILSVLLGIGIALPTAGVYQANPPQDEGLIENGIRLLSGRHYNEALDAFRRFKQVAPQDPRPYFYSGMALAQTGQLSAAASELSEAVRLGPDRHESLVYQANVLAQLKQKQPALKVLGVFQKQNVVEQLDPAWLKLLEDSYFRLEKTDEALKVLDLLARRTPDDPDVELNRGQIFVALGRSDLALQFFEKSIEKSPRNPIAFFEAGRILYERNQINESKKALVEAVRQDGTNPKYLQKLADASLALGEIEEAIGYLNRAEPSGPDFPQIYYALGRAYQRRGERSKADEYLKKFQQATLIQGEKEDRTRRIERLIVQGETQLDQGNTHEAQTLFEQAAQSDPDNWDAQGYLAEMFLSSGELELAYPHLVRMKQIDPDSVVGNYLMARYCYKRKEFERARVYAEKVEAIRPANSEARNLLGSIYLELGDRERAVKEFEAASHLAPGRADFREQLERLTKKN